MRSQFYNNLLEGKSGISAIEGFKCEDYSTRFAGEIKSFSVEGLVTKKMERRLDAYIKYIIVAGKKASLGAQFPDQNKLEVWQFYECAHDLIPTLPI